MSMGEINRQAETLGELLFRAKDGSPVWNAAVWKLLHESGAREQDPDQLLLAADTLAGLWRRRLTEQGKGQPGANLHPTEQGRLFAADYPADPSGSGRRGEHLTEEGAERHAYRQVVYGALGLPVHPDVTRALEDVKSNR